MRQRIAMSVLFVLLALVLVPSAQAKIAITSFTGAVYTNAGETTEQSQAGSTPYDGITDFTLSAPVPPTDAVKDIRVDLPPGLISNPEATAKCAQADFTTNTCDPKTRVGQVVIGLSGGLDSPPADVFNLEPDAGNVSDFGFSVAGLGATHIIGGVRDTGDYGLFFTISNASAPITHSRLTFWGDPGAHNSSGIHKPFIRLPTVCNGIQNTKLTVTSQAGDTVSTLDPTATGASGCDQLPFAPSISLTPDTTQRDTPVGPSIGIQVPWENDPAKLASSHVQNTTVVLPPGLTINPAAATGLQGCTDDQFGQGTHNAIKCPDGSKVGTVSITSPVLSKPLTGNVYLGSPLPDNPYRLFLDAEGFGLSVRLAGKVTPDPNTGQLTTTFANTPQVPFSEFKLTFNGGPNATLANPLACGDAVTTSTIAPYSGNAAQQPSTKFTVDLDGKGGACPPTPFAPTVAGSTGSPLGGAFSSFTLNVGRDDGQGYLAGLRIEEPPGLLGIIKSVAQCSDSDAAAGTCPDATKVGTATVGSGAGSAPFAISGPVYLTGPYGGGPFGLAIVIHAVAGPFDLGTIITRAAIKVDPSDSHLIIETPTLPTILQGIPLRLRTIAVAIDRDGFLFNPTNCGPLAIGALFKSTDGAFAQTSAPMQFTGCDALPYAPKMSVSSVPATNGGPAGLTVTLTQGPGEANTKSVAVKLPPALSARLSTVAKACPEPTFQADPSKCAADSRIGTVSAATPVLAQPLGGTVYLAAHTGGKLPTIEAVLQGSGVTVDLSGTFTFGQGITSTFGTVPDVPISSFKLTLPPSPTSALQASADLCAKPLPFTAQILGQNGKQVNVSSTLLVPGCGLKIVKAKVAGRKANVTVRVPAGGRITLSGKGLKKASKAVTKAGTYKLVVKRTGPNHKKKIKLRATFSPKKGATAGGAPVKASSAKTTLKFKK